MWVKTLVWGREAELCYKLAAHLRHLVRHYHSEAGRGVLGARAARRGRAVHLSLLAGGGIDTVGGRRQP